jgi:hypothetical protein
MSIGKEIRRKKEKKKLIMKLFCLRAHQNFNYSIGVECGISLSIGS